MDGRTTPVVGTPAETEATKAVAIWGLATTVYFGEEVVFVRESVLQLARGLALKGINAFFLREGKEVQSTIADCEYLKPTWDLRAYPRLAALVLDAEGMAGAGLREGAADSYYEGMVRLASEHRDIPKIFVNCLALGHARSTWLSIEFAEPSGKVYDGFPLDILLDHLERL